jgi:ribosome-associated protein
MNNYIELNVFIKIKGLVSTGGQAKILIRSNQIKVNGEIETRLRKKLVVGDVVEFENQTFTVTEDLILN